MRKKLVVFMLWAMASGCLIGRGLPTLIVVASMAFVLVVMAEIGRWIGLHSEADTLERVHRKAPWRLLEMLPRLELRELLEDPPILFESSPVPPDDVLVESVLLEGARGIEWLVERSPNGIHLVTFVGIDSFKTRWVYTAIAEHEADDLRNQKKNPRAFICSRRVLVVDIGLGGRRVAAWATEGASLPSSYLPTG